MYLHMFKQEKTLWAGIENNPEIWIWRNYGKIEGERSETEDQMEVNFLLYLLDFEGAFLRYS